MIGKALRFAADLVIAVLTAFWERHEAGRARLKGTAATQGVGLVGHATAMDRLAMHSVALVVVHLGDWRVNGELVEVRTAEP